MGMMFFLVPEDNSLKVHRADKGDTRPVHISSGYHKSSCHRQKIRTISDIFKKLTLLQRFLCDVFLLASIENLIASLKGKMVNNNV